MKLVVFISEIGCRCRGVRERGRLGDRGISLFLIIYMLLERCLKRKLRGIIFAQNIIHGSGK